MDSSTSGFIRIPVKVQGSYTQNGFFDEIEIERDGGSRSNITSKIKIKIQFISLFVH